ncbi:hypothetical protein PTKU64_90300 (plasmid) [Paraburkholderia terrae]|uniref:Uncharacterized protein n=1 Tax=Paraburkholderia terrae TaxID=311230 RepID=A0ABM7U2D1_9BURK|nr:hypothetical protein PTKU64_90300 [Paraburkholderia terrae]
MNSVQHNYELSLLPDDYPVDGGRIIGYCYGFVSPRDNRFLSPRGLSQFSIILDGVALTTGQRRDL